MEETKNTAALILDRRPYRESDSLVTVYTRRFGKQILVARGVKKLRSKLAGHLEPVSLVDIMIVRGKNHDYVGAASGRDFYSDLKNDLNKLYFAGRALGEFKRLVKENEADERLFLLLHGWLETLDNWDKGKALSREGGELLFAFFALPLLATLGYQPELHNCLSCQRPLQPGQNYFDLMNGGVIGQDCLDDWKKQPNYQVSHILTISDNCIKMMRFILSHNLPSASKLKIDKKTVKELYLIVSRFLEFTA